MKQVDLTGGLTPLEIASGIVFGFDSSPPLAPTTATTPREALQRALLPPLSQTPCGVAFSGGRDSSAVLAAATNEARNHGVADPVPITLVYPDVESTQETEYQESVVRHLGLGEWIRIEPQGRVDILSDAANELTLRHGLLFPGNIHSLLPVLEAVSGGALLTGIGGDEVLEGHRDHDLAAMLLGRGRPTTQLGRTLAKRYIAAGRIRRQLRERMSDSFPWMRPDAAATTIDHMIDLEMEGSLFADRYLASTVASVNYLRRAQSDMQTVASGYGVTMVNPLLDPNFIAAVAGDIGRIGASTRTEMMQRYFGGALPLGVIERTTKATFDDVLWTEDTTADALTLPVEPLRSVIDEQGLHDFWKSNALKGNTALIAKYLMAHQANAAVKTDPVGSPPD